jgi:hypothetical protein
VRSLALGGHTLALTLTLDEIFTLGTERQKLERCTSLN